MTLLAVPIAAETLADAERMIRDAERQGAELIELRLDLLCEGAAETLPSRTSLPVLATCRDRAEGGGAELDDGIRAGRIGYAVAAGAWFVDFELSAWDRSPEARQILQRALRLAASPGPPTVQNAPTLIVSSHDFSGPPPHPEVLLDALRRAPGDVLKLAYLARQITDCFLALDLLHESGGGKPAVALAMGEAGVMTRLLAKKLGAFCTFAALDEERGTAPGQPTLGEFKELFRWDRVSPTTELFGVIGFPVAHSMSPAIHNAAFDAIGYDGLYLPLLVEPDAGTFDALLDGIRQRNEWLDFRGLSVTIPHKENALRCVEAAGGSVEPLARRIGAVNTIRFEPDGSLSGRNTDYAAALDAVCEGLGCGREGLAGRSVAVLGAGGAARAIVAGFADAAARVTIYNRTLARAEALAEEFACQVRPLESTGPLDAEVIVNATSVGMRPHTDASPLPPGAIRPHQLVFDTVYNPLRTRLLAQAESAGARTVDGAAMFVRQAAAQFQWWTARPAPVEVMRRVVLDRLRSA